MEPAEDARAPPAPATMKKDADKTAAGVSSNQRTPVKSAALPPMSPHSKPATAGNTAAKKKGSAHGSEQSGSAGNRLKRDLYVANDPAGGHGSGTTQPSPLSTPAKPTKRPKTGSKTYSASPGGPTSSPGDFLKKLADYIKELGGEELEAGWEVDVRSLSAGVTVVCIDRTPPDSELQLTRSTHNSICNNFLLAAQSALFVGLHIPVLSVEATTCRA